MKDDETEHINKNLSKLIGVTNCNSTLLATLISKLVLDNGEVEGIQAKYDQKGKRAASQLFYETILEKDAYQELIEALENCKQSGAVAILKNIPKKAQKNAKPSTKSNQKKETYDSVVVGSDDCQPEDILEVLKESGADRVYQKNWKYLARKLKIRQAEINNWNKEIQSNTQDVFDILVEMLTEWKSMNGKEATIEKLIELIIELKWIAFAEKLQEKFITS